MQVGGYRAKNREGRIRGGGTRGYRQRNILYTVQLIQGRRYRGE